jgi:NAD(P)-dependent dehydrogenase (short-subunit alcohol dehydrogenase family)
MSYDTKNKTILITGANRGIGKAILEAFINQGAAKVYAAVRTLGSAQPLVATHGGPCRSTAWMLPTE